jgi:RNA polymerase sigma-70 factor (ECF subfamily)
MGTALTTTITRPVGDATPGITTEDFDQIVKQHQRRVYRVLYMLVRNLDTADTLTQECFLRAYEKRGSFRGECRLETWLLRIAVNLVRDHAKNRRAAFWKRLIGIEDATPAEAAVGFRDSRPTQEQALLARYELEAVWTAAGQLSSQQQTIFMLRFGNEMTLAEIAEVLSLKEGTVKTHLFRAVAAVREKLKEQQWR